MSEWRDVPGYEGLYRVSDDGSVFSVRSGRTLKANVNDNGYRVVTFSVRGVLRRVGVHRVVAEAFIGPKPEGAETMHLDGDKTNNRPGNLAYGSPSENVRASVAHGTHNSARKTHCPRGHEYTPENTQLVNRRGLWRLRKCRTCMGRKVAA